MTSFLDGKVNMLIGDVRAMLKTLPDDHFDCVVTSPPYWGLRDYGTGRWEGGDADCAHVRVGTDRTPWANSVKGPAGEFGKNGSKYANMTKVVGGHCANCAATFTDSQIGMEPTLGEHLAVMVEVLEEVRRVLKPTGTLWLNYGDCYATSPNGRSAADTKATGNDDRTFRDKPFSTIGGVLKAKDLCMIPNRLAIALQEAGWYVRSEIIWHKPNPMPESIRDRPTSSHEKIWLLTKSERYFYDADAIKEDSITDDPRRPYGSEGAWQMDGRPPEQRPNGKLREGANKKRGEFNGKTNALPGMEAFRHFTEFRNARNVWRIPTASFSDAHFATFPPALAERCIKAGCPAGGHILDPFGGAGTTALVAASLGRRATLIELNPEYAALARARIESAFMGREEGKRHMVKKLGKTEAAGPLFEGAAE